MNGKTEETSSLNRLHFYLDCKGFFFKYGSNCSDACVETQIPLCCFCLYLEILSHRRFKEELTDLMGLLQVNMILKQIDVSKAPWKTARKFRNLRDQIIEKYSLSKKEDTK